MSGWAGSRKRGKLLELNRLLRARDTSFLPTGILPGVESRVRYVITLDSDTRLPHGVAKRLVGTLAHPLNRPHFDSVCQRVTRGFGVLAARTSL